jgi:hypothetical protein
MTREKILSARRHAKTFEFIFRGMVVVATVSWFDDGRVAEVFVRQRYGEGSPLEADTRDAAVLLSLALQYGMPLDVAAAALTRFDDGAPCGVIGAVVDALKGDGR